jgi:phosphoribosyl 1,2-cyclic phosphodiesterase
MSLFIASLNSGSNGNCYYVGNEEEAVFVDAGLSCRETEKRMKRLGLPKEHIRAVFISHEHTDHISGVDTLARKYHLPVYGSAPTLKKLYNNGYQAIAFASDERIRVGNLTIKAFAKKHDAVDAHSFTVSGNGVTIGVFTDIGRVCDNLVQHFRQCHATFLEANYDEVMLDQGRYPHFLKNRIRGGHGHLSNTEALELMKAHKPSFMTHILLAHLSKDNNAPELARNLFRQYAGATYVEVASRYNESPVFKIMADEIMKVPFLKPVSREEQLSLF